MEGSQTKGDVGPEGIFAGISGSDYAYETELPYQDDDRCYVAA